MGQTSLPDQRATRYTWFCLSSRCLTTGFSMISSTFRIKVSKMPCDARLRHSAPRPARPCDSLEAAAVAFETWRARSSPKLPEFPNSRRNRDVLRRFWDACNVWSGKCRWNWRIFNDWNRLKNSLKNCFKTASAFKRLWKFEDLRDSSLVMCHLVNAMRMMRRPAKLNCKAQLCFCHLWEFKCKPFVVLWDHLRPEGCIKWHSVMSAQENAQPATRTAIVTSSSHESNKANMGCWWLCCL